MGGTRPTTTTTSGRCATTPPPSAPHSEAGGYINFMDGDDVDRVRANYGQNYDRLLEVKRKFDPENLFRINQNIAP